MSMTGSALWPPWFTCQDNTGAIMDGAKAYLWVSGTAQSTPFVTYSDVNLTVQNTTPFLTADAFGRLPPAYAASGSFYDFVLTSSTGASVRTQTYIPVNATAAVAGSTDLQVVVGENVTAGQTGYISDGSGGKVAGEGYVGDSSQIYSSTTPVVGVYTTTTNSGDTASLRTEGAAGGFVGLVPGSPYFMSTSGAVTLTAPTNFRLLGQALTTTTLGLQPTRMATATSQAANDFLFAATSATPGRVGFSAPGIPNFTTSWGALAPSTIGNELMSDGTNWASRGNAFVFPSSLYTLTNVTNNTETAALAITIKANSFNNGDQIIVDIASLDKNAKGSDGTWLVKVNAGAGAQITIANGTTFTNNATEFKMVRGFRLWRIGSDVWIDGATVVVSGTSGPFGPSTFNTDPTIALGPVSGISTPTNFTSDFTISVKVTLSATDAAFYYKPQSARIVQFKAS